MKLCYSCLFLAGSLAWQENSLSVLKLHFEVSFWRRFSPFLSSHFFTSCSFTLSMSWTSLPNQVSGRGIAEHPHGLSGAVTLGPRPGAFGASPKHVWSSTPQAAGSCRFSPFHQKEPHLIPVFKCGSHLLTSMELLPFFLPEPPAAPSTSELQPRVAVASVLLNILHFSSVPAAQGCLIDFETRHVFWDFFFYIFVHFCYVLASRRYITAWRVQFWPEYIKFLKEEVIVFFSRWKANCKISRWSLWNIFVNVQ